MRQATGHKGGAGFNILQDIIWIAEYYDDKRHISKTGHWQFDAFGTNMTLSLSVNNNHICDKGLKIHKVIFLQNLKWNNFVRLEDVN